MERINELRKQVNDLHVNGRPDHFRAGWNEELQNHAKEKGFSQIELDVWEFNTEAREFYEAVGFSCIRRYMEMKL